MHIYKYLPHRPPFVLVDNILNITGDTISTTFTLADECAWYFQGHFPGTAIFPGVLLIESMAQTACILGTYTLEQSACHQASINTSYNISCDISEYPTTIQRNTSEQNQQSDSHSVRLTAVEQATFHQEVLPEQTLTLHAKIMNIKNNCMKFSCTAHVSDNLVAQTKILATIT